MIELEARPLMTFKVLILVLYGVNTLVFILVYERNVHLKIIMNSEYEL